jgi:hydrogenase-4 component B
MRWTGAFFLVGSIAIAGLPLLNGFVSEWLTFQALLVGFQATPGLLRLTFPLSAALLALTSALAAACFVKAFGITFLALPRSAGAADAAEGPRGMLAPMAFLALACVALGVLPGPLLRALGAVTGSLPALGAPADLAWGRFGMQSPFQSVDHVAPLAFAAGLCAALLLAAALGRRARHSPARRVATWGCGGGLSAATEYTATAFSKPLMMIFRAVYRPTRQVESLASISPYFPQEVRYRAQIEPTFERYVYGPAARAVMRVAEAMKILQAGSLHAYLAYVLLLGVLLLIWLGGMS